MVNVKRCCGGQCKKGQADRAAPSGHDEDDDYEEEEAASLRPAKRARVATAEEDSGHASPASAPGQEEQQQPLQAERGLFP
jgi:hypothetical protein